MNNYTDTMVRRFNLKKLFEDETNLTEANKLIRHLVSKYGKDTTLYEVCKKQEKELKEISDEIEKECKYE